MTIARREIVVEGVSGVYHCISRCVRRAFLGGNDEYTGRSSGHRQAWMNYPVASNEVSTGKNHKN